MSTNILHIISSIDKLFGGPSKSLSELAIHQTLLKEHVTICTKFSLYPYIEKNNYENLNLFYVKQPSFRKSLIKLFYEDRFDIIHGHGIWQLPVHHMAKLAIKNNIPYIISPRGMLEPWALGHGKLKKKIALALYQYKDLDNAACIHATSQMEADNTRKLGFKNPIAVIPNGLNLSEFPVKKQSKSKEIKTILFLSRIHPKKGIELLIEAWSKLDKFYRNGWQVNIVGNGNEKYINELQKLISENNFSDAIKIIGPKFGKEKIETYQNADLFVLPTYSENFGMVITEALASGLPVITTKGTPWKELQSDNAGWWIDIGVEHLIKALAEAMQLNDNERIQMGLNGRKLVEDNYSIEIIAKKMLQLYEWILYKAEKPQFIM